jgi:hypothetical protein
MGRSVRSGVAWGIVRKVKVSDEVGENLALIVAAWSDMLRIGSTDALHALLDEKVVWNGVFPDEICHGRQEVIGILMSNWRGAPRISRIEAEENGDRVAVSVEGPDFQGDDRRPADGPRSLVFTFRNGHVIRMHSLKSRDDAFRLVERAR